MPNPVMPTYAYRPPARPSVPVGLRRASMSRARLWAGGTFFRSRNSGSDANNITVQVISETTKVADKETTNYWLVVTNKNPNSKESITGPASASILELEKASWSDLWVVDQSTTHTHYYSISCQIAFARQEGTSYTLPQSTDKGVFPFGKLFLHPGKLAVKAEKSTVGSAAPGPISITPRYRIYKLSGLEVEAKPESEGNAGSPAKQGFDIADLRTQLENDPWIEMPARPNAVGTGNTGSTTGGPPPVHDETMDAQDEGGDDEVGVAFDEQSLEGGDGLPTNPNLENTGPTRAIILVAMGEDKSGKLTNVNQIYEWSGNSSTEGQWVPY